MKRIIVTTIASIIYLLASAQQSDWENPHVFGINKLPYHATLQLPSRKDNTRFFIGEHTDDNLSDASEQYNRFKAK